MTSLVVIMEFLCFRIPHLLTMPQEQLCSSAYESVKEVKNV